jgi:hypothetical protein
MALFHRATITPTKAEVIAEWVPTRLVIAGGALLQVPLTYRDEPLEKAEDALVSKMQHSVLGTRWVYDGLHDPHYVTMLAGVAMTGQGEALGMALHGGRW